MSADRPVGAPRCYPDAENDPDTGVGSERATTTGPPRWVTAAVIVIAILVLLGLVLLHLSGGLGPGLHGGG